MDYGSTVLVSLTETNRNKRESFGIPCWLAGMQNTCTLVYTWIIRVN